MNAAGKVLGYGMAAKAQIVTQTEVAVVAGTHIASEAADKVLIV